MKCEQNIIKIKLTLGGKGTISLPVIVLFWSLVRLKSRDLTKIFILDCPMGLLSTHCFHTWYSSKGEQRRKRTRENISFSAFWIGVPVTAHLLPARKRQIAFATVKYQEIINKCKQNYF